MLLSESGVTELNWGRIALMLTAPLVAGVLVAYAIWRTKQIVLGNIAGTAVIFAAALGLILRESVEIDRVMRGCLDAGYTSWPEPSAFTRYAIDACIRLFEVFAVFIWSLKFDQKIRNRNYAPEWR